MFLLKVRWDAAEGCELPGAIGAEIHKKGFNWKNLGQQEQIVRDPTEKPEEKHNREIKQELHFEHINFKITS